MLSIWWSARRAPRVPELASESSRERRARTSANSAPTKKPLTATSAATAAKRSAVTCSVSARACASVHLHVGHTVAPRASRGLVLHGESVEKGEDHHRRPELDRAGRLGSKDELGAYAVLPDERHHAPGGEDGEQVERDRLQRQQERAKGARPSGSSSARSRRSLGAARSKWPGERGARPSQRRPVDFRGRPGMTGPYHQPQAPRPALRARLRDRRRTYASVSRGCRSPWDEPCRETTGSARGDPLGGRGERWLGCACAEQSDARNDDPHERQDECENTDEWHEEADAKDERSPAQPPMDSLATKKRTCGTEHHRPGCRQQRVDDVASNHVECLHDLGCYLAFGAAVGECQLSGDHYPEHGAHDCGACEEQAAPDHT